MNTKMKEKIRINTIMLVLTLIAITAASTRLSADTGTCSGASIALPFTDVMSSPFFCNIAEAYFTGLTNGTSPSTYSPAQTVTREQMSAFVTRTLDQSIKRGADRLAINQLWTPQNEANLAMTTVGTNPKFAKSDGVDVWVSNYVSDSISRVHASDGRKLGDWTGATAASGVLVAMGKVFATGYVPGSPGKLYELDPTQPPGSVTTLSSNLGLGSLSMAFDGTRIWTANHGTLAPDTGSVSIITLSPSVMVNTVSTGFSEPLGIVYDGANIWVTDSGDSTLKMLDPSGNVLKSVHVGGDPHYPAFDGTNIWVPNRASNTVSVVRAIGGLAGTVLATLNSNSSTNSQQQAVFDGQRILITNGSSDSVSLWNASDLTPIGTFATGVNSGPTGVCSDGLSFWIALFNSNKLARF